VQAWIAEEHDSQHERLLAAAQQSCDQLQQQHAEQMSLSSSDLPFQDPLLHLQVSHTALQRLDT